MSLPEALLKWLSLANHQDSNLTALQVSDGITMSQVLNKIDPKHFTQVKFGNLVKSPKLESFIEASQEDQKRRSNLTS